MDDGRQCRGDEFAELLAEKIKRFGAESLADGLLDEKDGEITRLRKENAELKALLREVEWEGWRHTTDGYAGAEACPSCKRWYHLGNGHTDNCRLAKALEGEDND